MQSASPKIQNFELVKELSHGVWSAIKPGDPKGEKYLARRVHCPRRGTSFCDPEEHLQPAYSPGYHLKLMQGDEQAAVIKNIVNHENLISIAGMLQTQTRVETTYSHPSSTDTQDYIVWEHCDAANIASIFQSMPHTSDDYYLPESLCWHVLKSLTRAMTWLHDGKRVTLDRKTRTKKWVAADKDWNPILHRAINPSNIFFQHPKGDETYGLCKLGNFSSVAVTNHVLDDAHGDKRTPDEVSIGFVGNYNMAMAAAKGWEPLEVTRAKLAPQSTQFLPQISHVATLGSELFSIGSVVFNMMTGHQLITDCINCGESHFVVCGFVSCLKLQAERAGCSCLLGGCQHVNSLHCEHTRAMAPRSDQCKEVTINIDEFLARSKYSSILREVARRLLGYVADREVMAPLRAVPVARRVEREYRKWREETKEGGQHKDAEDWTGDNWNLEETDFEIEDEDLVVVV